MDDCSAADLNRATQPQAARHAPPGRRPARRRAQEKWRHDTVDSLYDVAQAVHEASGGEDVLLFKADIDAAFRRVPLHPRDRDFAWVAFRHGDTVLIAQHTALPFGAGGRANRAPSRRSLALSVSSVHNWERVGALITCICRKLLRVALLRYVDDLFSVERASLAPPAPPRGTVAAPRPRVRSQARHALQCVVRVVRALLGDAAIADRKTECGHPLVILGLQIEAPAKRARASAARALGRAARSIAGASALVHPRTSVPSGSSGSAPPWQRGS